jgi:hypothetical protein
VSETWQPTPVFVRTHEVCRTGATVCSKKLVGCGSIVVQAPKMDARAAAAAAQPTKEATRAITPC